MHWIFCSFEFLPSFQNVIILRWIFLFQVEKAKEIFASVEFFDSRQEVSSVKFALATSELVNSSLVYVRCERSEENRYKRYQYIIAHNSK